MYNLQQDGVEIMRKVISTEQMSSIKYEVDTLQLSTPKYGIRNANKKIKSIDTLAHSAKFQALATEILGEAPQVVRVIYFDKTAEKNWLVPWHQDKTIALNKKTDIEGWGRWSIKDGIDHVQPSIDVLEQMVTFRVHLDDADEENGCLKVIRGSHTLGLLSSETIRELTQNRTIDNCIVQAGDMVIMRPHILHASSKSTHPKHRRIVHIEYSSYALPDGLEWA